MTYISNDIKKNHKKLYFNSEIFIEKLINVANYILYFFTSHILRDIRKEQR